MFLFLFTDANINSFVVSCPELNGDSNFTVYMNMKYSDLITCTQTLIRIQHFTLSNLPEIPEKELSMIISTELLTYRGR